MTKAAAGIREEHRQETSAERYRQYMASTDGTAGQDAKFGEMFGSGYGLEGGAHADWTFAVDPASEPTLSRIAPSAMDVAQRRQAKDHLEYTLRRRRRDIAEEVEVMDREDPYEKPEDNPDDMDNIITLRRMSLPLQIAGVDFRLKIHIRFCRAYA